MKIHDGIVGLTGVYQKEKVERSERRPASAAHAGDKATEVTVSERSRQLSELCAMLAQQPEVRQERIAHLKDVIIRGEYSVDSHRLAEALLKAKVLE